MYYFLTFFEDNFFFWRHNFIQSKFIEFCLKMNLLSHISSTSSSSLLLYQTLILELNIFFEYYRNIFKNYFNIYIIFNYITSISHISKFIFNIFDSFIICIYQNIWKKFIRIFNFKLNNGSISFDLLLNNGSIFQ